MFFYGSLCMLQISQCTEHAHLVTIAFVAYVFVTFVVLRV